MHVPAPALPVLVGRDRELAFLRERITAACIGQGGLVLIGGEAGIGKTALAEAICREATEQDALVLVGRCYDLSETPPYGPWGEALARAPADDALPTLPAAVLPPERGGDALTGQDAILRRARDYLVALAARQPVVLLVDDLHWADPASLDLLRVVGRGLADVPLLLLAAYRAEEVGRGHPLAALIPLLVREAQAVRLDLRPLDAAAIGALVAARYALDDADRDRLVRYLAGRTEGNALFLGELLRTLEGEGVLHTTGGGRSLGDLEGVPVPELLRQVIEGRVARLDAETERLLAVAAVVGQEVPLALWAAVGDVGEGPLLDHSDRAVAVRLVMETPDGAGVRFAHALIREALYEGISPTRRRMWHRRTGEALLATMQPDPDAVAHHFERAGDPRAFAWLVRAGLRARRAAANLTAAARFAAALPDSGGDRDRARGWLLFYSGTLLIFADHAEGLRALGAAEPLAVAAGDRALAAYIRIHRSQHLFVDGEIRRAIAELERGVAELDALPDAFRLRGGADVALETLTALLPDGERAVTVPTPARTAPPVGLYGAYAAHWRTQSGRYREGLALCEAFVAALAPTPGDDRLEWGRPAQLGLGHAHAALGHPEESRRAYAASRAASYASNNGYLVAIALWFELVYVILPYHADDPAERARLVAEAATAWERARGAITGLAHDDPTDLFPALLEGRWDAADRLAQATLSGATAAHSQGAMAALGMLARYRGEPERAWERVRALHPAGPETEPGDCFFVHGIALQAQAAELALDAGDLGTAADWIAAHDWWLDWAGAVLGQSEGAALWARYHRQVGEMEQARAHATRALAHATEPRQPLSLLAAHRLLGELDTDAGRHAEADDHLDAALALADACAAPYERALILLAHAELHAATHRDDDARAALGEARAICVPLGAGPALTRADALEAGLGPASPSVSAAPDALTTRELEVLRLLAGGSTIREIAVALFLSARTVERHITTIYRKIGARGRVDAVAYALRHGVTAAPRHDFR